MALSVDAKLVEHVPVEGVQPRTAHEVPTIKDNGAETRGSKLAGDQARINQGREFGAVLLKVGEAEICSSENCYPARGAPLVSPSRSWLPLGPKLPSIRDQ